MSNTPKSIAYHGMSESNDQQDMHVNPQRAKQLAENISHVVQSIKTANTANRNV